MTQVQSDLFDKLESLPQEYIDFILEIEGLSQKCIEAEYLLDELYETIHKQAIKGHYSLIPAGKEKIQKAKEFQDAIVNSESVFSQIVRIIDDQDDFWTWHRWWLQDSYDLIKEVKLEELVKQFGNSEQQKIFDSLLIYMERYKDDENKRRLSIH